ncbi:MAG TPA: YbaN family protein [Dysgonomonas sp.]|uniref:YbaN family protein n=1 Tax=unclassified Dysgonomonas TaxID=2630389 RepID=UPI0025C383E8|nr:MULTISPECIES: YbaN family protein [unclassified Dysgonomonas]HML66499.1 YbaN family protein [Dysgonomonas sp.]
MKKYLFIILGLISLGLGLLGIVTPGLPTTPFILLTGVLFAKSSPRLHQKLLDHKITGPYIRRVNNGFSTKGLIISISIMWTMIILTTLVVFKSNQTMQLVMVGLGFVGTVSQIIVLRKRKKKEKVLLTLDDEEKDNNKLKAS